MKWFLLINIIFMQACTNLPANIKNPPRVDIQLQQVLKNYESYQQSPVRWGGTIINVENKADSTNMQILFYPLDYFGRPKTDKPAFGRFMTTSKLFLDPDIFTVGTKITVVGKVQSLIEKQIGKKSLTLPVIAIDNHHIWPNYRNNYYENYGYSNRYYGNYYGNYFGYNQRYYYPYSRYSSRYSRRNRYYGCY